MILVNRHQSFVVLSSQSNTAPESKASNNYVCTLEELLKRRPNPNQNQKTLTFKVQARNMSCIHVRHHYSLFLHLYHTMP